GLPGGCPLGPRPIDQHIKGFEALGAKVTNEYGAMYLEAEKLTGAKSSLTLSVSARRSTLWSQRARLKARRSLKTSQKNRKSSMWPHCLIRWEPTSKVQVLTRLKSMVWTNSAVRGTTSYPTGLKPGHT